MCLLSRSGFRISIDRCVEKIYDIWSNYRTIERTLGGLSIVVYSASGQPEAVIGDLSAEEIEIWEGEGIMALNKKPVTGMRDILPEEMAIRDYVVGIIKETYGKYGF